LIFSSKNAYVPATNQSTFGEDFFSFVDLAFSRILCDSQIWHKVTFCAVC